MSWRAECTVEHLVTDSDGFEHKVAESLAVGERGEMAPDEQVRGWLEQRESS
jgi:hypothetical protein